MIVVLTAYAMKGDEEKARRAGCDGYISKPIETRTFVSTLVRFLGMQQEGQKNDVTIASRSTRE